MYSVLQLQYKKINFKANTESFWFEIMLSKQLDLHLKSSYIYFKMLSSKILKYRM